MLTELDCLMAGVVGGFVAAMSAIGVLYWHFRMGYRDYVKARDDHKLQINVKKLMDDSETMKIQIAAIHAEIYNQFVEDQYR